MARQPQLIGPDDVRAAQAAIAGRVHRTPVFGCRSLGERVVLKAEGFQRTGSFKFRGALHRIGALTPEERRRGVVTFSAGNHAQAVALACREVGVDARVFMPAAADAGKVAATRAYGASVDQEATTTEELVERVQAEVRAGGRTLVHPFDDPLVMAGQGTVGLELLEQAPQVETVLVPVSGGGLLSGIAAAVGDRVRIVAVEPAARPNLSRRLGRLPDEPSRPTIADALTAPFLGDHCFAVIERRVADVVTVSEEEIAEAVRFLQARAKLVAEAGAAVGVAAQLREQRPEAVGIVLSGANVAPASLARILAGA